MFSFLECWALALKLVYKNTASLDMSDSRFFNDFGNTPVCEGVEDGCVDLNFGNFLIQIMRNQACTKGLRARHFCLKTIRLVNSMYVNQSNFPK